MDAPLLQWLADTSAHEVFKTIAAWSIAVGFCLISMNQLMSWRPK